MATLAGSTIASTYDRLLALPSGGLNGTTLVALTDGNASGTISLQVATTKTMIEGSGNKLFFHDEGDEHISATGGVLSIAGGSEIDLTATAIDINGTVDISGTLALNDDVTIIQNKKIYFDSTDTYIYANTDNPEDLVIGADADIILEPDGSIGIKESSPLATLHINSSGLGDNTTALNSGADDLCLESASGNCGMTIYSGGTTSLGLIYFGSDTATNEGNIIFTHSGTADSRKFSFGFSSSIKFNFLATSNLGIGSAAVFDSGVRCIGLNNGTDPGGATANTACLLALSGEMNYTDASGNIATLDSLSDERAKDNIAVIPDALSRLANLKGVTFNYVSYEDSSLPFKDSIADDVKFASHEKYSDNKRVGVIAQDVERAYDGLDITNAVMNLAVESADNDDPEIYGDILKTRESTLIPLLIEAVKELSAKVDVLESA
jgi:hypothetical protein